MLVEIAQACDLTETISIEDFAEKHQIIRSMMLEVYQHDIHDEVSTVEFMFQSLKQNKKYYCIASNTAFHEAPPTVAKVHVSLHSVSHHNSIKPTAPTRYTREPAPQPQSKCQCRKYQGAQRT